jgi:L-threonylcarbamoyladenylate synthase
VHPDFTLSASGDIEEAAANLFAVMHQADQMAVKSIAFAPIPMSGLGLAINDRLSRAAAPRDSGKVL